MSKLDIDILKKDVITGFITRTFFEIEEKKKIQENFINHKMFCMFADFNFLKFANDLYGYSGVDKALKVISKCIRDVVSEHVKNYKIIRYGGDEIFIFGNGLSKTKVINLKNKVQNEIKELPDKKRLGLSIAIGYCFYDEVVSFEEAMTIARDRMKVDKVYTKGDTEIDLEKVVNLLIPTIERMIPKEKNTDFIKLLEEQLKR